MRLQWNGHRRLQVAFADERKRVELFRDFVGRSGFHNRASPSGVTAKPDLSNQTGPVEATYHLALRLPELCGSRGFRLIGMPGEQGHELHFEPSLSCEAWFPEGPGYGQAPGAAQPGIRMDHPGSAGTAHFSMAISGTPRRRVKLPSSTRAAMTARRRTISANAGGPNASFTVGGTVVTQSRPEI